MRQGLYGIIRPLLLGGAAVLALAAGAQAQGFGGSFGDGGGGGGATGGTPTQPIPPAGGGGEFGGSFGGGTNPAAPIPPAGPGGGVAAAPTPPAGGGATPGGSDFGGGGSFNPDVAGAVTPPAPQPTPPAGPQAPPPTQAPPVDNQLAAFELRDFGVPPTNLLRQGQFHGPTPTSFPGGKVVTTAQLAQAMQGGTQMVLIDVLGGDYTLPGALKAPALASPGDFRDAIQQQATQWLRQITQGNPTVPVVIYCSDPQCWLSYNGALRAVAAGFTNVYWYRGGVQAWQMAGLPLTAGGF